MARYIDADALIADLYDSKKHNDFFAPFKLCTADIVDLKFLLNEVPTVDAVPVVRCGECKNYDVETAWCKIHSCFINRNGDFCHPWESSEWKMFDGAYYCADGGRADNGT